jgi:predicted RNase H-like HicB family nuclease
MYTAIYKKSGKYYSAWVLEVPGVNTQGKTKQEAQKNLKEALSLVMEARGKYLHKEIGKARVTTGQLAFAAAGYETKRFN